MATVLLNDVVATVDGNDLSDFLKSIRLDYNAAALDDTVMGDGTKSSKGGLKEWSGQLDFLQDYGVGGPDVTLFDLIGTVVTFTGKPTSSATGATNPKFSGSALLTGYPPIQGTVGELATTSLAFTSAGTLSRLESD